MRLISVFCHLFIAVLLLNPNTLRAEVPDINSALIEGIISIGGLKGGNISKEKLLASDSLTVQQDSIANIFIISFRLTVVYKSGSDPVELESIDGGKLTDAMRLAIQKTYKGCNVFVEFIKSRSSDGTVRTHPPLSFKIVD